MNQIEAAEEELRQAMELLFFAYRDFTAEADAILAEYGMGRAHHRAIYFVGRNPAITVNGLLAILKITKQSLSRVLAQLVEEGFVVRRADPGDRRRRRLYLTAKAAALEGRLSETQFKRIAGAYAGAGPEAVKGFRAVLRGIIGEEDRGRIGGE